MSLRWAWQCCLWPKCFHCLIVPCCYDYKLFKEGHNCIVRLLLWPHVDSNQDNAWTLIIGVFGYKLSIADYVNENVTWLVSLELRHSVYERGVTLTLLLGHMCSSMVLKNHKRNIWKSRCVINRCVSLTPAGVPQITEWAFSLSHGALGHQASWQHLSFSRRDSFLLLVLHGIAVVPLTWLWTALDKSMQQLYTSKCKHVLNWGLSLNSCFISIRMLQKSQILTCCALQLFLSSTPYAGFSICRNALNYHTPEVT